MLKRMSSKPGCDFRRALLHTSWVPDLDEDIKKQFQSLSLAHLKIKENWKQKHSKALKWYICNEFLLLLHTLGIYFFWGGGGGDRKGRQFWQPVKKQGWKHILTHFITNFIPSSPIFPQQNHWRDPWNYRRYKSVIHSLQVSTCKTLDM